MEIIFQIFVIHLHKRVMHSLICSMAVWYICNKCNNLFVISNFVSNSLLLRSLYEGGKRSVFLTNTQALARQQAEVIGKMTSLNVRVYTGDMDVDNWGRDKWTNEFESAQVKSNARSNFLFSKRSIKNVLRNLLFSK